MARGTGLCSRCGKAPKNKWGSYCNPCYNEKRRERGVKQEAQAHVELGTPVDDLETSMYADIIREQQVRINELQTAVNERNTLIERLCTHLDDYRPDLTVHYREAIAPQG